MNVRLRTLLIILIGFAVCLSSCAAFAQEKVPSPTPVESPAPTASPTETPTTVPSEMKVDDFIDGLKLYYQKRFEDSEELFLDALKKDPLNTMALSFYLSARYRSNELIKAVNYLEQKAIDGGETAVLKAHVGIGYFTRGLIDSNMMEEARSILKQSLAQNPDLSIANTGMGMIYYQKRLIPRAKGYFVKAVKSNPRDLMALERIGEILMLDDKNPQAAMDYFNQVISLAPEYSDGYFYAGSALQKMKKVDEAIVMYEKCIKIDPLGVLKGYHAPLRLGDIYAQRKEWEEAEKYYKKALAINPDNPYAQTQLKRAKARGVGWEGEKVKNLKLKKKLEDIND